MKRVLNVILQSSVKKKAGTNLLGWTLLREQSHSLNQDQVLSKNGNR